MLPDSQTLTPPRDTGYLQSAMRRMPECNAASALADALGEQRELRRVLRLQRSPWLLRHEGRGLVCHHLAAKYPLQGAIFKYFAFRIQAWVIVVKLVSTFVVVA